MRHLFHFLITLPETCSRMTYHELLLMATVVTLTLWIILMVSGRKLA